MRGAPCAEAMCEAHSHGVRVIADGRPGVAEALKNANTRYQWVSGVKKHFLLYLEKVLS